MRTPEQILERFNKSTSMFGFDREVLMDYLSYEQLKLHLKPEAKAEDFKTTEPNRDNVMKALSDYLKFAWEKADNHRGLSANRSVEKLKEWIWLLGDDQLLKDFEEAPYENYGCPKLKLLSQRLNLPMPQDEGVQRMAEGLRCHDGCENGCGK